MRGIVTNFVSKEGLSKEGADQPGPTGGGDSTYLYRRSASGNHRAAMSARERVDESVSECVCRTVDR